MMCAGGAMTQAMTGTVGSRAFRMKLKPGNADEYRRRHDEIWPELAGLLGAAGIHDYSIFLDEATLDLFAVLKLRQGHELASLPGHPVMQRWWDTMADLMEVEPGNRPKEWPLTQVFHLA
jgi:L-rhamnose mutarotase